MVNKNKPIKADTRSTKKTQHLTKLCKFERKKQGKLLSITRKTKLTKKKLIKADINQQK